LNQLILAQNDEFIVALEEIIDSEEKSRVINYEYPTTLIYHDFVSIIEE